MSVHGRSAWVRGFVLCLLACAQTQRHALADDSDSDESASARSALVQVTALTRGSIARTITLYGTVQASPLTKRSVTAPGAARVEAVLVHIGQGVAPNAPLVRLGPTPATAASFAQAQSEQRVARDLLARTRELLAEHLATAQQLADAEKGASDARAALQALAAAGAGGTATLGAPYRATVTGLTASAGAIVAEGAPLVELARSDSLVLEAGIVPAEASAVAAGDTASVRAPSASTPIAGRVLMRGAAIDPASGLVPVEIALRSTGLFPGESATAIVTTGTVSGFIVPHTAVLLDDEGNPYIVQVVDGAAKKVPVRVLGSNADRDGVAGELLAGAPVVLAGNYQLENGMKVRIASPAAP